MSVDAPASREWMEAEDYPAYIAELRVQSEPHEARVREQIAAGEAPAAIVDCFRAALIEASLRTWAMSLTPEVVARAVDTGLWSPERALSLASIIGDAERRAVMYGAISVVKKLTLEQAAEAQQQMFDAVRAVDFAMSRAMLMERLSRYASYLNWDKFCRLWLESALEGAKLPYGSNGFSLCRLMLVLPDGLKDDAERGILALDNPEAQSWALSRFILKFPEGSEPLLEKGLEAAARIPSEVARANALLQLAPYLRGELVNHGLEIALALNENQWIPRAVEGMMVRLNPLQIKRVLEAVLSIESDWWRADALMDIATVAEGEDKQRALEALLTIEDEETLWKIARLPGTEAAAILRTELEFMARQRSKTKLLDLMAEEDAKGDSLPPPATAEQLEAITTIVDGESRYYALNSLILTDELLPTALDIALGIESGLFRDMALQPLVGRLNADLLRRALKGGIELEDIYDQIKALSYLVQYVDEADRDAVWGYIDHCKTLVPYRDESATTFNPPFGLVQVDDLLRSEPISKTRADILDDMLLERASERGMLLSSCHDQRWFAPPVLSREILGTIALTIVEICR